MHYKFCSMCGGDLLEKGGNLVCKKCPFVNYRNPRPTVTALVVNKDKLLFTKRGREPFKGLWDLPGGFIEKEETPAEALKRELKEETGLIIEIKKLLGIYPGTYPLKLEPFHVLSVAYIVVAKQQKLSAFDDVVDSRWFPINSMPKKIAFDSNQDIIKDFKKIWN